MIESDAGPSDFTDGPTTDYIGSERRGKPRLAWCCQATVCGTERDGGPFEINAAIEDISASGLYLRLSKRVEPGAALFLKMRFSNPSATVARGPLIAIYGRVLRVEAQPDGEFGTALAIERHEFL